MRGSASRSVLLEVLSLRHHAQAEVAPANEGAAAREEEERWRRWTDERFVRLITVNIYRSMRESFQMFDYIADTGVCPTPSAMAV